MLQQDHECIMLVTQHWHRTVYMRDQELRDWSAPFMLYVIKLVTQHWHRTVYTRDQELQDWSAPFMLSVINKYSDVKRCTLLNYQVQYLLGKSLLQGYQQRVGMYKTCQGWVHYMLKVKILIAVTRHLPVYYTAMGDFSNISKVSYSPELPCIYLGRSLNNRHFPP